MEIAPAWIEMRGDKMIDILREIEQLGYVFYSEIDFEPLKNLPQLVEKLPSNGGVNVVASTHSFN
jgi:hypothetical protein